MNKMLVIGTLGALALVGCKNKDGAGTDKGSGETKTTEGGSGKTGESGGGGSVTLNASGSSLQKQFQEEAVAAFGKGNPNIKINYGGGGSGKGRQDFADQVTDFGCTDAAYKPEDAAKVKGGEFLYIPNLLAAITVSYNVDGVDKLNLSADTIAKIFQRDIKKWNDPAIAAENKDAKLPDADIVVAHRSDGSGTTENFTKFLAAAAGDAWKLKSGGTVEWPADTQAGNGNSGVAQIVKSTKGAIGYVDLPDAKASGLKYAMIKNSAGKYIEASSDSASAAGEGIDVQPDLTYVAVNAKGDAAYPITAPTWCLIRKTQTDKAKGTALKSYFKYMVTDGQKILKDIDFAPLPKALADRAAQAVDSVVVQ